MAARRLRSHLLLPLLLLLAAPLAARGNLETLAAALPLADALAGAPFDAAAFMRHTHAVPRHQHELLDAAAFVAGDAVQASGFADGPAAAAVLAQAAKLPRVRAVGAAGLDAGYAAAAFLFNRNRTALVLFGGGATADADRSLAFAQRVWPGRVQAASDTGAYAAAGGRRLDLFFVRAADADSALAALTDGRAACRRGGYALLGGAAGAVRAAWASAREAGLLEEAACLDVGAVQGEGGQAVYCLGTYAAQAAGKASGEAEA